jgi:hypothetical protein
MGLAAYREYDRRPRERERERERDREYRDLLRGSLQAQKPPSFSAFFNIQHTERNGNDKT